MLKNEFTMLKMIHSSLQIPIYVRPTLYIDGVFIIYVILLWLALTYTSQVLKLTQM
jgi:hypothetical protein